MKRFLAAAVAAIVSVSVVSASHAALISYFDFNDGQTSGSTATSATLTDRVGTGTLDVSSFVPANVVVFTGSSVNLANGSAAGNELALQTGTNGANNSKSILFTIPKTGYEDVVITYSNRRSSTGFNTQQFDISSDGTNFTPAATVTSIPTTSALQTVDLSSSALADAASTLYVRVTFSGGTATAAAGNNRIDNVQFNATAVTVPEPAAFGVLAPAVLFVARRRRA